MVESRESGQPTKLEVLEEMLSHFCNCNLCVHSVRLPISLQFGGSWPLICRRTFMSSVYASGYKDVSHRFNVSEPVSLLGVALFCIGLLLGPLVAAPLNESFGRSIIHRTSLLISVLFVIGFALWKSFAAPVICRFLAGLFCSPALSIGGGTNADSWDQRARRLCIARFVVGPTLSLGVGKGSLFSRLFVVTMVRSPYAEPVIGGLVDDTKGGGSWTG